MQARYTSIFYVIAHDGMDQPHSMMYVGTNTLSLLGQIFPSQMSQKATYIYSYVSHVRWVPSHTEKLSILEVTNLVLCEFRQLGLSLYISVIVSGFKMHLEICSQLATTYNIYISSKSQYSTLQPHLILVRWLPMNV